MTTWVHNFSYWKRFSDTKFLRGNTGQKVFFFSCFFLGNLSIFDNYYLAIFFSHCFTSLPYCYWLSVQSWLTVKSLLILWLWINIFPCAHNLGSQFLFDEVGKALWNTMLSQPATKTKRMTTTVWYIFFFALSSVCPYINLPLHILAVQYKTASQLLGVAKITWRSRWKFDKRILE